MSLQEALKQMRLELGMTQNDLAKRLDRAFISVNRWENGKGFPSRANAQKILEIAKNGEVSKDCFNYLNETLMPDTKRCKTAAVYGFPEIERDFLFQLADGSTNSLYVVEAGTYNLLYANRVAEQAAVSYVSALGAAPAERKLAAQKDRRCFHYFGNRDKPCTLCPLAEVGEEEFTDKIISVPELGRTVHVHAKRTKLNGRDVYTIYQTDITKSDAERNALYALTNDIPDGVGIYQVFFDERIELTFMNEALFKMIGPEKKELLLKNGESDLNLIHPCDRERLRTEIRSAIEKKRDVDITLRMQIYDGSDRTVHLKGRLIQNDTEKFTFYCLFHAMDEQ